MAIMNESGWTDMNLETSTAAFKQLMSETATPQVQEIKQNLANVPEVAGVREIMVERSQQLGYILSETCHTAAEAFVSHANENDVPEEIRQQLAHILTETTLSAGQSEDYVPDLIVDERVDEMLEQWKKKEDARQWEEVVRNQTWEEVVRNQTWEEAEIDPSLTPPTDRQSAAAKIREKKTQEPAEDHPVDNTTPELKDPIVDPTVGAKAKPVPSTDREISGADLAEKIHNWINDLPETEKQPAKNDGDTDDGYITMCGYLEKTQSSSQLSAENANDVDYDVLSELAYARKYYDSQEYRLACEKEGLTVAQYCEALLNADPDGKLDRHERDFLTKLKNSTRYKDLVIDFSQGVTVGNVDTNVIAVSDGSGHGMIAIQGTNGSTTDWINDDRFVLPYLTEEEEFINKIVQRYADEYDSFDICGHSQGGRDAVTAAAFLSPEQKMKLRMVYSQDGPGYTDEFMANYGHQFEDLKGKTRIICPEDSYVGAIFTQIVDVIYVEHQSELPYNHDHLTWKIKEEPEGSGCYKFVVGEETELTRIIREFTQYVQQILSPEAIAEILPIVLRLLSNPENPAELDFKPKNIIANLENLSPGDVANLAALLGVILFDVVADFLDRYEPQLRVAQGLLAMASMIPGVGRQPLIKLARFIVHLSDILHFASKLLNKCLEYKARKLQAQREKYIAGNPTLHMDYDALNRATAYLEEAQIKLQNAAKSEQTMLECFYQKTVSDPIEELIGDIVKVFWEVTTAHMPVARAIEWVVKKVGDGVDFMMDTRLQATSSYISKGLDTIDVVTRKSLQLSESAELGANEEGTYTVTPSALNEYAVEAGEKVQAILTNINAANSTITDTGSIWQAQDYDSIKTLSDHSIEAILTALDRIAQNYESVGIIASAYSALQSTAVQEFQAAAN